MSSQDENERFYHNGKFWYSCRDSKTEIKTSRSTGSEEKVAIRKFGGGGESCWGTPLNQLKTFTFTQNVLQQIDLTVSHQSALK